MNHLLYLMWEISKEELDVSKTKQQGDYPPINGNVTPVECNDAVEIQPYIQDKNTKSEVMRMSM